ncbi:MAG TPA: acyl-ACP thioesterase domain-containing protein [Acidimicrobiales bacterium]|nr:acyl-ACP thioesterase domain-containing protein [Acidimicrobiales bacterium]
MTEFLPRPAKGRRYRHQRRVRLSDAGPDGVLRLDGVARYLQDVATDDWADSGLDPEETWVVRRTAVRVADGGSWPALGDQVALTTWCGGTGPAWAERRTDLEVDGALMVETVALWVPLDRSGRPLRLGPEFHAVYGEAAGGRRVSGRVPAAPTMTDGKGRPWPIRQADLDIVGHVNNAAVWAAVTEVAGGPVSSAELTHHGPVENGGPVTLVTEPGRMWLMTEAKVRVSAEFA